MAGPFKVRLPDGIEVGPLDVEMLRSWYEQGMINRDTQVRPAGSKRWARLIDSVNIQDWGASGGPKAGRGQGGEVADEGEALSDGQRWRTHVASALFFLSAAGTAYFAFVPDRWLASLRTAPLREIALALALFGLLLVRGWEAARKLVRVLVVLATFGLFPLAGILIAQGLRGRALVVLLGAWVMGSGLFYFLSGAHLSGVNAALGLLAILGGAAGVGYFGFVPPTAGPATTQTTPVPAATAAILVPSSAAIAAITGDAPHLSARAVERILAAGGVQALEPQEAFRRGYALAARGLPFLEAAEIKELGDLTTAMSASFSKDDRVRLTAYMERVRGAQPTTADEDLEMSRLMKGGVLTLGEPERARLQALYEKAVSAATK